MRKAVRTAPYGTSPRVYCAANPLRYTDPTGMGLEYEVMSESKSVMQIINHELEMYSQGCANFVKDYLNNRPASGNIDSHYIQQSGTAPDRLRNALKACGYIY